METAMKQYLDIFLQQMGYAVIPSNLPEFTIYFRPENNLINVIHVITDREGLDLSNEQFEHVKNTIYKLFEGKGFSNIHILSLIISENLEKVRHIAGADTFCWMIEPNTRRIIIYENQTIDFYGIKNNLEEWLMKDNAFVNQQLFEYKQKNITTDSVNVVEQKKYPYVTIVITALNILVFLICTFTGELLYNKGALDVIHVFQNKEYYRVLTCMFLHADVHHLFSNMVMFYFLGEIVEMNMGHIKYGILYFLSGIGGGCLSMGYSIYSHTLTSTVGASGAIFGVVGALLWLAMMHRGQLKNITIGKVLFLIIYSMYSGFTGTNIDNAAHIGGLITGFLATIVMGSRKNEG